MTDYEKFLAVLRYEPLTGRFFWKRDNSRVKAGGDAGCLTIKGYAHIHFDGGHHRSHRVAWLLMQGSWPPGQIDHKNGIRSDNRWANLRLATSSQNGANRSITSRNSSGFKGVTVCKNGKFEARIGVAQHRILLGRFATATDAHAAYVAKATDLFGEFARAS